MLNRSRIVLFLLSTLTTGCKVGEELNARLDARSEEYSRLTQEMGLSISGGEVRVLDWDTALGILEERNIQLRRGRTRIEDLKRQRDEQWKDWLPRVGLYANLFSSLSDLGNLAFTDPSVSVIAPLNIPNPLTERARAFDNALSYLRAVDSEKLAYRRLVVRLYGIYSSAGRLEQRMAAERTEAGSVDDGLQALETRESYRDQIGTIRSQMVQILNLPGEQPYPASSTRPELDYSGKIHKLVPGKNYGELAVKLMAYQIEGALLAEKGIKLRKWPAISLSASSPPLYDSNSNSDTGYFDPEQISLFGSLAKSYEFTGQEARSIESAEENTQYVKENLRLNMDQEAREWERLRKRYRQLLERQEIAEQRLARIRRSGPGGSAAAGLKAVRSVSSALESAKLSKEQLDTEIWVWDERKWN